MITKVSYEVDLWTATAQVTRNCDEKYARKLLQDWLKANTLMPGGWEVVKDFDKWNDPEIYYFDVRNIFYPYNRGFSHLKVE